MQQKIISCKHSGWKEIIKKNSLKVRYYLEICKPRTVCLLYFTALTSIIIASSIHGFDTRKIIMISVAIILGVMGSNAAANFFDREMDSTMMRTRNRAIPSGKISPRSAIIFALILVAAGTVLAAAIDHLSAVFLLLGFLDSAVIYNWLTKKRSSLNVLLGSPAGGLPILVGWTAITGKVELLAVMMFLLVVVWTPAHIWSLAYFYKEDYRKAKVPMLPVIWGDKKVFILLGSMDIIIVIFSILMGFLYRFSIFYFIMASAAGLALIIVSVLLLIKRSKKIAWLFFKVSSPYLAVIFILLIIEYTVF